LFERKVNEGLLKLLPIASSLQVVDIYTKPLAAAAFKNMCTKLGMSNIYFQLEGG